MEPAISTGDGYVLVPADDVSTGDIVTFWSPTRDAYVTHRVVDRTADGFVTKGDNNPTTDQAAGFSAVSREQMVGEVFTVGGSPVVVPHLGTAIAVVRERLLALLAGCLAVFVLLSATRASGERRGVTRVQDVFQPLFVVGLVSITGLLAFAQPGHEVTLVAVQSASASDASRVIAVGAEKHVDFVVYHPSRPLLTRVVETRGLTDTTQTQNATAVAVSGTVPAPTETGPVRVGVDIDQYPAVLPRWLLAALPPLLASAASAVAVLTPPWLLYHALVDPRTPLRRRPSRLLAILRRGQP